MRDGDVEALKQKMDEIRFWVSYRGQTLSRTGNIIIFFKKSNNNFPNKLSVFCLKLFLLLIS